MLPMLGTRAACARIPLALLVQLAIEQQIVPPRAMRRCSGAVVNALVSCGAPPECCMGLVPRGHGPHDIAASLDIPMDVSKALRIAADGRSAPLDVGIINHKRVNISVTCMPAPSACISQHVITARDDRDDLYL